MTDQEEDNDDKIFPNEYSYGPQVVIKSINTNKQEWTKFHVLQSPVNGLCKSMLYCNEETDKKKLDVKLDFTRP